MTVKIKEKHLKEILIAAAKAEHFVQTQAIISFLRDAFDLQPVDLLQDPPETET